MSIMPKIPRRVVTGLKNGVSTIIEDMPVEHVLKNDAGFVVSDAWATDQMSVNLNGSAKIAAEFFPTLNKKGTLLRYVHIPPDSNTLQHFELRPGQQHPLMHQTDTLDYVVILSGEVYLVMEQGETLLKPGDIVIQCATNHAWSNRSTEPCTQLAILLEAEV